MKIYNDHTGRLNQDARLLFLGELVNRGERPLLFALKEWPVANPHAGLALPLVSGPMQKLTALEGSCMPASLILAWAAIF